MIDGTCDGCFYSMVHVGSDKEPNLKCRRFPPQVFVFEDSLSQGFPDAYQRCGEFRYQPENVYQTLLDAQNETNPELVGCSNCGHAKRVHDGKQTSCTAVGCMCMAFHSLTVNGVD